MEDEVEKLPATSPNAGGAAIENPPNRPEYLTHVVPAHATRVVAALEADDGEAGQRHRVIAGNDFVNHGELAAQRDRAEVALQADVCLAAEQAVALQALAGVGREARFEHEQRLVAAAQVFQAVSCPSGCRVSTPSVIWTLPLPAADSFEV